MTPMPIEKLPMWRLIMFAMGQMGWSLAAFGVGTLVVYFYMPPEVASGTPPIFPSYIFQGTILGILTVVGIINAGARFFDAITNPIIATWSDTCKSKMGRRRFFMAISAVPFALFSVLVFFPMQSFATPPTSFGESWINIAWLTVTILAFYFFFVMYATPYTALISELGHTPEERLTISTAISVTWALGFVVGNSVYALQGVFQNMGMDSTKAFQMVLALFAALSLILMLLPVIFVDEHRYAEFHVSNEGVLQALGSSLKNTNFFRFISSELFYWICLSIIQMGMVYFVTTLLSLEKELVSLLMLVMFFMSFVFYLPINIAARRLGKKTVLTFAYLIFSGVFFLAAGMGILPIPAKVYAFLIVIVAALPIAIFGILPNAIVADIAEADGIETGNYKAGIFFGVRTFEMNLGISIANILFPSLLILGKTVENPAGIRTSAVVAGVFCLFGMLIFRLYDEKKILTTLASKQSAQ
jgi:Na+/melibiose symporter-like transporter